MTESRAVTIAYSQISWEKICKAAWVHFGGIREAKATVRDANLHDGMKPFEVWDVSIGRRKGGESCCVPLFQLSVPALCHTLINIHLTLFICYRSEVKSYSTGFQTQGVSPPRDVCIQHFAKGLYAYILITVVELLIGQCSGRNGIAAHWHQCWYSS